MDRHATYIGTATVLLELGPFRLLTDPALDPPGGHYGFGFGTGSDKQLGPSLPKAGLGRVDAVLLSHDHHADNLDREGRALLPHVPQVLTTVSGARRLGGNARGLAPWESQTLTRPAGESLRITATPARHGPAGSRPFVGDVIGFLLEWPGQTHGAIYLSGDTVYFSGLDELARRHKIDVALLHLGGVRFPVTGPIRYTFRAAEAARFARTLNPRTIVPIHYDGWSHFVEDVSEIRPAFEREGFSAALRWLPRGERVPL